MPRRRISSGSHFEAEIGYSRAVADGDHVWVSGTTGYDYATMTIAPNVVAQAEQCFRNIAAALAEAGCTLDDVVRATFIVPDRADWPPCWPVVKKHLGGARPASTLIHAGLQAAEMRIEIEVTARRRQGEEEDAYDRRTGPNDPFARHEALHMASVLGGLVDQELLSHPTVQAHPRLKVLAKTAVVALADLHRAIGGLEDDPTPKDPA